MHENIGLEVRRDVNSADLIGRLHPNAQEHASNDSRRTPTGQKLPPGVGIGVLLLEDFGNDVVLCDDRGGVDGGTIAFESSEDLEGFIVFPFADQQTRRIRKEGTQGPDEGGEEALEGQGKPPGDRSLAEAEAEGEPVGKTEAGDAVCHLDDDELPTTAH